MSLHFQVLEREALLMSMGVWFVGISKDIVLPVDDENPDLVDILDLHVIKSGYRFVLSSRKIGDQCSVNVDRGDYLSSLEELAHTFNIHHHDLASKKAKLLSLGFTRYNNRTWKVEADAIQRALLIRTGCVIKSDKRSVYLDRGAAECADAISGIMACNTEVVTQHARDHLFSKYQ